MFGPLVRNSTKFTPVSQEEDHEALLPCPSCSASSEIKRSPRPPGTWYFLKTYAPLVLLICVSGLFGVWLGNNWVLRPDRFCIRHTSQYSPIVKEVDLYYETVRFNGSLLKANIFRGPASPEVDAAWESLGVNYRAVVVPVDQATQSGIRPDQVKVSQRYGGGFPANVEGLHHLHCLNLLRKALTWNYEYYHKQGEGPFTNSDYVIRYHVTHCLDVLRQQLMCTVDVGVLGQIWYHPEGYPMEPFVDFHTNHKCRNFEAVRAWAEKHQLPPEENVDMQHFYELPKEGDRIVSEIP
ncbi:hypothetical protein BU16DRAFT_554922 [Lophium mytilinum]|uniref:Tat pathway signal sequence n=1 Tax=Lophium mytilinum TaxID=390894 RepID=A0A6A6RGJ9_9PEZI|nr:hypothetical protein BU16DRAFT_554922 [Lophium mytilinum]